MTPWRGMEVLVEALSSFGFSPCAALGKDASGRPSSGDFTEVSCSGLPARGGAGTRAQIGREG